MNKSPYSYNRRYALRYTFVSRGPKGAILKVVEFTPLSEKNILNLGFGDMLPDGTINDTANTNNNDIVKVLATVIEIVNSLTLENPDLKIFFVGNTLTRTSLYRRILKMYYSDFNEHFVITAVVKDGQRFVEKLFEPDGNEKCVAFFIKRKL